MMRDKLTVGVAVLSLLVVGSVSVGCGRAAGPAIPTSTVTTTATTTPLPSATASPEAEVSAAYLAYWDAYSRAVLNLDASLVERFAAAEELASIREEIEAHRRDGVAVRIAVEHDFAVVQSSRTGATVVDKVINRSFYVDPVTKQPERSDAPGTVLRYTFFLERAADGWIVVRGLRESP